MVTRPPLEPPRTNSLLRLDIGLAPHELAMGAASRLEGHEGGDLLIAAPGFEGDLLAVAPGLPVLMRWTGPRGVFSLATDLFEVRRGQVTTWRVRPVGPVQISQRRNYVRAPLFAQMALVPVDAGVAPVTTGWLVDLSEGGFRARVSGIPLELGTLCEAQLELEQVPITVPGSVLRSGQVDSTSKTHELVVVIDAGRHADRIRRIVFRVQVQARSGGAT